jgi:hypothetical protein
VEDLGFGEDFELLAAVEKTGGCNDRRGRATASSYAWTVRHELSGYQHFSG